MLNKCVLQGRFVNTPELRTSAKGTNFVTFSRAVQGNRKIGEDYPVSFIDCEAWRSTAARIERRKA